MFMVLFHQVLSICKDRENSIVESLNEEEAVNLYDHINKVNQRFYQKYSQSLILPIQIYAF